MSRKICVITAARSEYGPLRWLIQEIRDDPYLTLQLVVTGSHLSKEMGNTFTEIENDGFQIDEKVEMISSLDSQEYIAKSMGQCIMGITDVFIRNSPDLIVLLGDRYELLPICSVAVVLNIPIAHISGGDITEGAIDDQVRHAVTKMASFHFPGTEESAKRIIQMGEFPNKVFVVGEPGLENFKRLELKNRVALATEFGWDINKKWVLFTYHSETTLPLEKNLETLNNILKVLNDIDKILVIMTKANADFGGSQINQILHGIAKKEPSKYKLYDSLGYLNFLSTMKSSWVMVGNSSSGIIEAPSAKLPVINIGDRQKGRYTCENVINSKTDLQSILAAFEKLETEKFQTALEKIGEYYGTGNTSLRILKALKSCKLEVKRGFYEE